MATVEATEGTCQPAAHHLCPVSSVVSAFTNRGGKTTDQPPPPRWGWERCLSPPGDSASLRPRLHAFALSGQLGFTFDPGRGLRPGRDSGWCPGLQMQKSGATAKHLLRRKNDLAPYSQLLIL